MTPQEWTPISLLGSYTPNPTSGNQGPTDTNPSFVAAAASSSSPPGPRVVSGPLPSLPPSPPLPPLPPKSPSALIAQYFPRSLPLPPSKGRAPYGQREAVVAPTPFKTPTFGPALVSTTPTTTLPDAPPLPSPSASFHYIPSADTSRTSTSHAAHNPHHNHHLQHNEEDTSDFSSSSNRPSPNPSAIGLHQGSSSATTPTTARMMPHQQHPGRLPSDLDLILHNSRHRPGLARSTNTTNTKNAGSISSEGLEVAVVLPIPTTPTPILLFAPPRPRSPAGVRASPSTTLLSNPAIPPRPTTLPTTPIYPRGLASSSMLPDSTQVIIRLHQKPVPYIRELVPGKETGPAIVTNGNSIAIATASPTTVPAVLGAVEPSSASTSRDLELVLDEITGRLKTNRTSIDPWTFTFSPWDEKPLPPVRRERGARYWVFRDQDGLVPGPILFLVGHLFPPLWWVGSLYPRLEHPDETAVAKAEMEAHAASVAAVARAHAHAQAQVEGEEDNDASDRQNGVALQWLHRQLKTLGVSVASITLSASSSKPQQGNDDSNSNTIATLQMAEVPYDNHYHSSSANEREGSTLATHVSRPPLPPPPMLPMSSPSILDSRGPWAARGSNASSLFEQRMAYDRKVLRYELDLRWRRINLVWSFVSLLLAISTVAIVYGVRK
ncbi:hypothetical protein BGX29_005984 [Mortierella sp. GBA35]|nr:hypothetical protein BGX29_005984 [Mortierella sp. GBA35]